MNNKNIFDNLLKVEVKDKLEVRKQGEITLNYLSWASAWEEFKKNCPDATYEIKMFDNLPYTYDDKTGYMVFTSITVNNLTHSMWLPVMNNNNKAMKAERYNYFVKNYKTGEKIECFVEPATMFDINKTIMRCLVKNMAMFGLGLSVYKGEDLPEEDKENQTVNSSNDKATVNQLAYIDNLKLDKQKICQDYKINSITELTKDQAKMVISKATGK